MRVDPVRLDPHPGAAVVGVGRVMEPVEGVQSAVLPVRHRPVVAMGGPGSRINPLRAEVVSPLVVAEQGRVHLRQPFMRVERAARVKSSCRSKPLRRI